MYTNCHPEDPDAGCPKKLHDQASHLGIFKTTEKVKERFYWPGYEQDIRSWVQNCVQCQQCNPLIPQAQAPLGTIQASYPFEKMSWDIMGPMPVTDRHNKYILVITDVFTKWVEAFPLQNTTAETLAACLVKEVACRYGERAVIHSDQGANLCGDVVHSMCHLPSIQQTRTSAYHPQGNRQVERLNRTVQATLAKAVKDDQEWDLHLPQALFAHRTLVQESTGFTPFLLTFGRSPKLPIDRWIGQGGSFQNYPDMVQKVHIRLVASYSQVRRRLAGAHQRQKKAYNSRSIGQSLAVGDRVWYLSQP